MRSRWWVIAFAGLACSGGAKRTDDGGGGPVDTLVTSPDSSPIDGAMEADGDRPPGGDALDGPASPDGGSDAPLADAAPADSAVPAALSIDMSAFIFGPTPFACESAAAAVLTVSNLGGSATAPLRVTLGGTFPDRFRVDRDGCSGRSLPPAGTCVVEVRFVPRQLMDQPATAELLVAGAAGEEASAALAGEARPDDIAVFPWMTGLLDFGTVKVGATSAVVEDTWTNNTDLPATPGAPVLAGDAAADFTITTNTCSGKSIAPRQSCRLGARLAPSASGQRLANVVLPATGACGYDFRDVLTLNGAGE
jgi:hypothetical protein